MIAYQANPRTLPTNTTKAPFVHEGTTRNSILVISAKERSRVGSKTGDYYICVDAYMTSTYSIMVTEITPNASYSELV